MIQERDKGYKIYFGDDFEDVVTAKYVGSGTVLEACWDVVKRRVPEYIGLEWELLFIRKTGTSTFEVRVGHVERKTEPPVPTGIFVEETLFGIE
jgi:hypothetical protein